MAAALLGFLATAACAKILPPPGGPPDARAPQLVSTRPESLEALPTFRGDVEFIFDEIVSEGGSPSQGSGTGDLEKLVILSPTTRIPRVRWHRSRITVRPSEGWQPNRVYRVELVPGVADLRNNRSPAGRVVTFTTGAPLPTDTLNGQVVDWVGGKPAALALIEAILQPDSLPYRTQADSGGRFRLGPLPRGEYLVYGILDLNHNQRRDGREGFDTIRVAAGTTAVGTLWAFPRDTLPPRIANVTPVDSFSATVTFIAPLDPYQQLTPDAVRLQLLPDSTAVPIASLLPKRTGDSIQAAARPAQQERRAAPARQPPPVPAKDTTPTSLLRQRPPLSDKLVLRTIQPLVPEGKYVLEISGIRTATGIAGTVHSGFTVPAPKPPPKKPVAADSVKADSLGADSLPPAAPR